MTLRSEIFEQPERIENLLASQRRNVEQVAAVIRRRGVEYVLLAARGTSDNAGRYANYLLGAMNGLPLALAAPSLFTYYKRPLYLKNALVIGISQSGASPDIAATLEEGRRRGCLTLALTNDVRSPLANASELVLDIHAGRERAVAATKTYTAELMTIAMLSVALSGVEKRWRELGRVANWMRSALKQDEFISQAVERYRYADRAIVLGRGFNYATAFEWALKLKELAYVMAEPYSPADFAHGPIAMLESGFPVFAVASKGKVFPSMQQMLLRLKKEQAADLVVVSNDKRALALAQIPLMIPADIPEWLSPFASVLPAQLFAYHLTLAKGHNAEKPRAIHKITRTK